MTPELFQFAFSHYNEKARWALDWKRVPHRRRSLLPGPHAPNMLWRTRQKLLPALHLGDEWITGSARIIDWLERTHPEPPLYPKPETERREALELARWFDDEVGAPIRCAAFFELLRDGDYSARCLAAAAGPVATTLYRAAFPLVREVMRRDMQIDDASAERGRARTLEAFELVARRAGRDGYLVGGGFSVADLTAASLLCVAVFPKESPIRCPEPRSPALLGWLAHFAGHPGAAWLANVYRKHRGLSAEIPG